MSIMVGASRGYVPGGGQAAVFPAAEPPAPPGGPSFPRVGGMLIGSPHNYDDPGYQAQIAQLDMAILGMYNGWNGNGHAAAVNAIKAINPNILLGNYNIMTESPSTTGTSQDDVMAKLNAEVGPGGVGDWWAYNAAGAHTDWAAGGFNSWDTNLTLLTTPDGSGDRFPQWLAKRDNTLTILRADFDIWFADNNFWRPRSDADWDRNGTNDSAGNETVRNNWRDGQRAYYDTAKSLQPNIILMVNADSDLDGSVHPSEATPFTQYKNVLHGAYLEHVIGRDWSVETWGGWSMMMGWYHKVFDNLLEPKVVFLEVAIIPTDYQTLRYSLGSALMNDGYFGAHNDGDYNEVVWFDEYDLAGTSSTKWLGEAVDSPQTAAWQNGVYRRRFENGLVLVNPKGNGQQTVTVGAGYHRFSGTQDPVTNDGTAVTSTVTLADRDGSFLVKD